MNCSTPGLPVHHQLLEFTQTYVHWVSDAIQPSHPLSSPFPPAPNPSQHQSLFQWVNSSHEVAKVLEFNFSIIPSKEHPGLISFRMDWFDLLAVQECRGEKSLSFPPPWVFQTLLSLGILGLLINLPRSWLFRYCTVRLKMFYFLCLGLLVFLCIICVKSIINFL